MPSYFLHGKGGGGRREYRKFLHLIFKFLHLHVTYLLLLLLTEPLLSKNQRHTKQNMKRTSQTVQVTECATFTKLGAGGTGDWD